MLRHHAPPLLIPKIMQTKIHYYADKPDEAVWKLNENGKFTTASAWNFIRQEEKNHINSLIWQRYIPFKMSFLLWRALRMKLPTNDQTSTFGVEPVECSCCLRPGLDNIEHIWPFCYLYLAVLFWFSGQCS